MQVRKFTLLYLFIKAVFQRVEHVWRATESSDKATYKINHILIEISAVKENSYDIRTNKQIRIVDMRTIGKMCVGRCARMHASASVDTQCSYYFANKKI